ncbi:hypothetical protein HAP41_0000028965 [Bradyrhizobium barranii subsp. apii]|uniref:Uncharacterized protein n=1 Tax=Bradyrhizobium barranii subsp. apii TaxID=2819348 RepID=A0A8T5VI86_9BRAD|nr:hypothetical protein [Bradyrhizobium barranii]UPT84393.1 hypothetical protein HAP41_0000028965 [Bradyrhizobium barranii subsp. apii]
MWNQHPEPTGSRWATPTSSEIQQNPGHPLLDDGEAKKLLQAAEKEHRDGNYGQCLADCRKAFFVTFETWYDTQRDLDNSSFGLLSDGSRAPYYARSKDYIEKNVKDHFGYVVLDHAQVDQDLTKEGIDHTGFWNVWRLTPQVYRHKAEDKWRVKHDPRLYDEDGFQERSALVLSTMTSILLARQNAHRAARYVEGHGQINAKVNKDANIYDRADKSGAVTHVVPNGKEVWTSYATEGMVDDDWYWWVMYSDKEGEKPVLVFGYVLEDDLILT